MSNIRLKRSAVPNRIPTIDQVELGELVINSYDGKLFLKKDINGQQSIVELGASNGGGSQGTQGTSGIQGLQGNSGSQGTQGISGAFVAQGIQGNSGSPGSPGSQGIQGISGAFVAQGIQGNSGSQGIQGIQGIQGNSGSQGTQGIQGNSGSQGTQGTQGIQGIQGNSGSQGTQGIQGISGAFVAQGIQGLQGATGISSASWGSISGTLNNQTDLSASLGLKAPLNNPIFTGTITAPTITNTLGANFATTSGNVGIGTSSPSYKLHVAGTGYLTQLIQTSTTGSGGLLILSNTARSYSLGARGDFGSGMFNIVDENAGLARFSIFSNGNIGVGTVTDNGFKLDVSGSSRFIDVTCTSITETSSERYKENIYTLNNALDKVISLRGVQYNLKDNKIVEIGVIAEEIANILPEVIKYNNEGQPDSVSYGRLSAVFIEAIKQQQKQIELLKQEINLYIKNKL